MADYEVRRRETVVREEPVATETVVRREPVVEAQRRIVEDPSAEGRVLVSRLSALIWLFFGIVNILIVLRLFMKLIAANPNAGFAQVIYSITDILMLPFINLVASPQVGSGILEIPAIIALIVYTLAAWIVVRLFRVLFTPARTRHSVTTYRREL